MAEGQRRLRLLCEDRRTERFIRRLCERYRIELMQPPEVAPVGKGAASAWVLRSYASQVRKRRSKSFQANLGLLVVIDGDNVGMEARLRELDAELRLAKAEPRGDAEPIAIFVPTWSIETWLAHLSGIEGIAETRPLKGDGEMRALWRDGTTEATTIRAAVGAWNGSDTPLPSLLAAYAEAPRVGLPSSPRP
jgi:hypothetical protein